MFGKLFEGESIETSLARKFERGTGERMRGDPTLCRSKSVFFHGCDDVKILPFVQVYLFGGLEYMGCIDARCRATTATPATPEDRRAPHQPSISRRTEPLSRKSRNSRSRYRRALQRRAGCWGS